MGIELHAMAARVRAIVPELIGLSLAVIEDGITLTLVASAEQIAALDAVQYLDGGPCVADLDRKEPLDVNIDDLFDEHRWQMYAQASGALGVASSLSLPIMDADRVMGGVNLYAATLDAFTGRHEQLADAIGTDAALAIANADLSFRTKKQAAEAPGRVRALGDINIALGIIAESQGVTMTTARERLRDAAAQAGISEEQAAQTIRFVRGP
ncbi:GAF domain-containing protein [Nocardioides caldifontis]|uniref:GAF domain-containing protein n=1 Tax=Nocardioides caldifontis TaxID=2588938 RepID=UPI001396BC41|nr:GAF domain-containing protein [Nocardioides caldifontis]